MTKTNQVVYITRAINKLKEHDRNITILSIDSGIEIENDIVVFSISYSKGKDMQIFIEKVEINA